jgi:hypothetical protein
LVLGGVGLAWMRIPPATRLRPWSQSAESWGLDSNAGGRPHLAACRHGQDYHEGASSIMSEQVRSQPTLGLRIGGLLAGLSDRLRRETAAAVTPIIILRLNCSRQQRMTSAASTLYLRSGSQTINVRSEPNAASNVGGRGLPGAALQIFSFSPSNS